MTPIISRAFDVSAALDVSVAPSRGPWQEHQSMTIMTLWHYDNQLNEHLLNWQSMDLPQLIQLISILP